jgi:hypothetical protein
MSARELGSLFDAHKPPLGVDESLGASFIETSRSSRNLRMRPVLEQVSLEPMSKNGLAKLVEHIHTSRRYSQSSQGMKTPDPRQEVFETKCDTTENQQYSAHTKVSERRASMPNMSNKSKAASSLSRQKLSTTTPLQNLSSSPIESITVYPVPEIQSPVTVRDPQAKKAAITDNLSTLSPHVPSSQSWKPNAICQDSVLTYASNADWPDVKIDKKTGNMVRTIKAEREGIFRASGVLMGVRFMVGV